MAQDAAAAESAEKAEDSRFSSYATPGAAPGRRRVEDDDDEEMARADEGYDDD